MSKRTVIILLIIGIIIGAAGAHYLPGKVRSYLPESITGKTVLVKGTVLAKEKKGNVLRLTIDTPQGALLATFTEKVDETNLLVNVNDVVEFELTKYEPFISDPRIYRVLKGAQPPMSAQEAAPAGTAASGATTTKAPPAAGQKGTRPQPQR
jgi:hypothetical protein